MLLLLFDHSATTLPRTIVITGHPGVAFVRAASAAMERGNQGYALGIAEAEKQSPQSS
jgi:hypothetical protein